MLYDRDGIRLEVLDYLSNSEIVQPAHRAGFFGPGLEFRQERRPPHLRQAYVRLTVDDQSEEFWMPCSSPDPVERKSLAIPEKLQQKTVAGKGRRVELSFVPESFHLGYSIYLHKAWRKLDPGTRQPSFYGSEIDLVPSESAAQSSSAGSPDKQPPKYENLLVTLNAPLDFADPAMPGRSYRMFQSTMTGPYNPEEFDLKPGESVYLSGFTAQLRPGTRIDLRGLPADRRRHFRRLFRPVRAIAARSRKPLRKTYETTNPRGGSRLAGVCSPAAGRAFRRSRLVGVAADARVAGRPHHAAG